METIRIGSTGPVVTAWQQFLRGQDLYMGEATGSFDNATAEATKAFQANHGLPADGIAGNQTFGQAMVEGFVVVTSTDTDKTGPNWPPVDPNATPATLPLRQQLFGVFQYVPAPSAANPEAITILGNWAAENIVEVHVPQLEGILGAPANGVVPFHKAAANQLAAMFQGWQDAGLMDRVKTFAGTWAPRFVRGSRTNLSNHCLPATADVWTMQGPASIADLKGYSGHVWSFAEGHAVPGKVTGFFNNGRKPLLKIRAVGHEITCTPNHPVLILRKKTLQPHEWVQHPTGRGQQRALYWTEMVRAEFLRPGDRLVGTKMLPTMAQGKDVSGEWAEILGLFLGDGCLHHRDGTPEYLSFAFPQGDRVRDHASTLFARYFGEIPKSNDRALIYYKQSIWERFLPYDHKARDKMMPSEVWGWTSEAKARLLLGLLYSDGTVNENQSSTGKGTSCRYRFRLGSKDLAQSVRMLMASLGFRVGKLFYTEAEDRVIVGTLAHSGPSWTAIGTDVYGILNPAADPLYIRRIEAVVRPNQGTTRSWGYEKVSPNFSHHKIQSIEYVGEGEVFDIEVDAHHNFLTDGVVVSNSWGTAIDLNAGWNPLGGRPALVGQTGSTRELVDVAVQNGFYWGGWGWGSGRFDGMHFEVCRLTP